MLKQDPADRNSQRKKKKKKKWQTCRGKPPTKKKKKTHLEENITVNIDEPSKTRMT
jgi:hypothetical protein